MPLSQWSAPELALNPDEYSIKADVWAFGVLVYEVMTYGADPYGGKYHGFASFFLMQLFMISKQSVFCLGLF